MGAKRYAAKLFCSIAIVLLMGCTDRSHDELTIAPDHIRAPGAGALTTAGYLSITSPIDDALVGASIDGAGAVEIHTMSMEDGVMHMRRVNEIPLPAHKSVALAPGGDHLMIFEPGANFEDGSTVQVTLVFEKAGEVTVDMPVQQQTPRRHRH